MIRNFRYERTITPEGTKNFLKSESNRKNAHLCGVPDTSTRYERMKHAIVKVRRCEEHVDDNIINTRNATSVDRDRIWTGLGSRPMDHTDHIERIRRKEALA